MPEASAEIQKHLEEILGRQWGSRTGNGRKSRKDAVSDKAPASV